MLAGQHQPQSGDARCRAQPGGRVAAPGRVAHDERSDQVAAVAGSPALLGCRMPAELGQVRQCGVQQVDSTEAGRAIASSSGRPRLGCAVGRSSICSVGVVMCCSVWGVSVWVWRGLKVRATGEPPICSSSGRQLSSGSYEKEREKGKMGQAGVPGPESGQIAHGRRCVKRRPGRGGGRPWHKPGRSAPGSARNCACPAGRT